jgi:four helix bundle protein
LEGGYRNLEIYQRAHKLAVEIHRMSLELPEFEKFEQGGQIRRSSKSVTAQMVEGYCLRRNKAEFVQYLNRSYAACHETLEHLELLRETGSLADRKRYDELRADCESLCKMIFRFLESVLAHHEKPGFLREESGTYSFIPKSEISYPTSG